MTSNFAMGGVLATSVCRYNDDYRILRAVFALTAGPSIAKRSTNSDWLTRMSGRAGEIHSANRRERKSRVGPFLARLWNKKTTQPCAERRWLVVTIDQMCFWEVNRIVSTNVAQDCCHNNGRLTYLFVAIDHIVFLL